MLYDPKWQDLTYSGVSLRAFIAWLETKPASEAYDFGRPLECAAAQYLKSIGKTESLEIMVDFGPRVHDSDSDRYWLWNILVTNPQTFGGALHRAKETLNALRS